MLDIKYTYYKVKSVSVTKVKNDGAGARTPETEPAAVTEAEGENAVIVALTSGATFTNKYTPYTSKGSWTPKVTKVVRGGEMKEFTLELADNDKFDNAETVTTDPKGEITPLPTVASPRPGASSRSSTNSINSTSSRPTPRAVALPRPSRTMCARKLTVRCSRTINMTSLSIDLTSR